MALSDRPINMISMIYVAFVFLSLRPAPRTPTPVTQVLARGPRGCRDARAARDCREGPTYSGARSSSPPPALKSLPCRKVKNFKKLNKLKKV